jgi:hypothetical protein
MQTLTFLAENLTFGFIPPQMAMENVPSHIVIFVPCCSLVFHHETIQKVGLQISRFLAEDGHIQAKCSDEGDLSRRLLPLPSTSGVEKGKRRVRRYLSEPLQKSRTIGGKTKRSSDSREDESRHADRLTNHMTISSTTQYSVIDRFQNAHSIRFELSASYLSPLSSLAAARFFPF